MEVKQLGALTLSLTEQTVNQGQTTFTIERLSPMEGYQLIDTMRNMIGNATTGSFQESPSAFMMAALTKLPHKDLEYIRKKLFERVQFTRPDTAPTPRPLAGSEDIAFEGLDAGIIYEMIVRAFSVNFTDILQRVQDALETAEENSKQSAPTQSHQSSQHPSPPNSPLTSQSTTTD